MSNRTYNIKIYKITTPCNNYFITGCYNVKITSHFNKLLRLYNEWKNNLINRKCYKIIFGFFENYGTECNIELINKFIGTNDDKKIYIKNLLDGIKDDKNYNNNNNVIRKYKCYWLKI